MQKILPIILFGVCLAFVPKFLDLENIGSGDEYAPQDEPEIARSMEPIQTKSQTNYTSGKRQVRIKADRSGHFRSSFKANGRQIDGLIDTGATYVAINKSTARSLGISVKASDFIHKANTANGQTKAAFAKIRKLDIGSISIRNVETFILEDSSLSSNLIGMSFMSQLSSFRFENSELILVQ